MNARRLRRAMDKAHHDGVIDGLWVTPRDPSRRGVEVGWTKYLRWAYDAGHEESRRKVQQLNDDLIAAGYAMTLEEAAAAMVRHPREPR